ncbi:hypothetical protein BC567DRAFT_218460 [Phyllosticta citribraziliensis]
MAVANARAAPARAFDDDVLVSVAVVVAVASAVDVRGVVGGGHGDDQAAAVPEAGTTSGCGEVELEAAAAAVESGRMSCRWWVVVHINNRRRRTRASELRRGACRQARGDRERLAGIEARQMRVRAEYPRDVDVTWHRTHSKPAQRRTFQHGHGKAKDFLTCTRHDSGPARPAADAAVAVNPTFIHSMPCDGTRRASAD